MQTTQDLVEQNLNELVDYVKSTTRANTWLTKNAHILDPIISRNSNFCISICAVVIRIYNLTHADTLALIAGFAAGEWTKDTDGDNMVYSSKDKVQDYWMHLHSELPPCCRIVEEEVEIPAQKIKRNKVICEPGA